MKNPLDFIFMVLIALSLIAIIFSDYDTAHIYVVGAFIVHAISIKK